MSDYYEYYMNNPHELPSIDEYEQQLHEEVVEYLDDVEDREIIDFAYTRDLNAANAAHKRMAQAYYDGNDAELLVWAKTLSKLMVDQLSYYVERERM